MQAVVRHSSLGTKVPSHTGQGLQHEPLWGCLHAVGIAGVREEGVPELSALYLRNPFCLDPPTPLVLFFCLPSLFLSFRAQLRCHLLQEAIHVPPQLSQGLLLCTPTVLRAFPITTLKGVTDELCVYLLPLGCGCLVSRDRVFTADLPP